MGMARDGIGMIEVSVMVCMWDEEWLVSQWARLKIGGTTKVTCDRAGTCDMRGDNDDRRRCQVFESERKTSYNRFNTGYRLCFFTF